MKNENDDHVDFCAFQSESEAKLSGSNARIDASVSGDHLIVSNYRNHQNAGVSSNVYICIRYFFMRCISGYMFCDNIFESQFKVIIPSVPTAFEPSRWKHSQWRWQINKSCIHQCVERKFHHLCSWCFKQWTRGCYRVGYKPYRDF